jgi:multidrug efflux pump subunit AcrA (membrane-fusion protein)
MTANATLTTDERQDVLLIPNRAITADRQTNKYSVKRVDGKETENVEVTIGLRDGQYTEVTSGLQEGDRVSIAEVKEELRFGPPGRD